MASNSTTISASNVGTLYSSYSRLVPAPAYYLYTSSCLELPVITGEDTVDYAMTASEDEYMYTLLQDGFPSTALFLLPIERSRSSMFGRR